MKKHWIEYRAKLRLSPLTFWVHLVADGQPYHLAQRFEPPMPSSIPDKGYPYFFVEIDSCTFEFASLAELDYCVSTFSKRAMPTSLRLTEKRGANFGPGKHWLSQLPDGVKSWRYREKAIKYLQKARVDFVKEISGNK